MIKIRRVLMMLAGIVCSLPAFVQAQYENYQLPVLNFKQDAEGFYLNVSDEAYLRYMWDSFVAINWPAEPGVRGKPDVAATQPASSSPLVWETYAKPQEVFPLAAKWPDYPQWNEIKPLPAGLTITQAKALCAGFSPTVDIILYDINQPNISIRSGPVAPLLDQHRRYVRYQVAMNRSYFEYVRSNEYFNAETQLNPFESVNRRNFMKRK